MTAVLSAIQPAGETVIFDPQNSLESLSRLRTVQLRSAIGATSRSFNFSSFLKSVVPQPFLQTVDLSIGSGVRENYPSGLENVAPLIR